MKISDVIRKVNDNEMAKIIGAVVAQHIDGISTEEAVKLDYPHTLQALQEEVDVDYKQTNADRIRSMSDEELAKLIAEKIECTECPFNGDEEKCGNVGCSELVVEWLQSEVEEQV